MKRWIVLLLALLLCVSVLAGCGKTKTDSDIPDADAAVTESGAYGDLSWTLLSNGTLTIAGTGAMDEKADIPWSGFADKVERVVIKEGVTSVSASAVTDMLHVKTVMLPASVGKITSQTNEEEPRYLFGGCPALESITVAEGNPAYLSEDGVLFNKEKTELLRFPQALPKIDYAVPDSVETIGDSAFADCVNLKYITIDGEVVSIGDKAFYGCTTLDSIEIPDSVQTIGESAFASCTAMSSAVIGGGVTQFGQKSFAASGLESVTISSGASCIGDHAFEDCVALKTIKIPKSVKTVGSEPFKGCESLTDVNYEGSEQEWQSVEGSIGSDAVVKYNVTGKSVLSFFNSVDDYMYFPVLVIILALAGLFFTFRTRFVQLRLFGTACKLIVEKPQSAQKVSSFQALMVSTASRVGTGNIVGVSTAICIGGPGACFWMWLMCIIGASSAFIESTLAQVFKQKDKEGHSYGGPAYYIEKALKMPVIAAIFCVFLIATYAFGFNLLCSYNLQSSFAIYSFYDATWTPLIVGAVLAVLVGICLMGGGKRIVKLTEKIVPAMGVAYVLISLIIIFANIPNLPGVFSAIFRDAFDFRAIFGGVTGSCMVLGIKRGLFSNEAGVGSAPNASASADVTHPVKQGLVQTISVYIDTMLLCTATALMCLASGVTAHKAVSGAPYVQYAVSSIFGGFGPIFITVAMVLFAFTTLIGNLYYVDNALAYLNHKKKPSRKFMNIFYIACVAVIFVGTLVPMDFAWTMADITMGGMTLINIPCCIILSGIAVKALKDFESQRKQKRNPVFKAKSIGLDPKNLCFWKDEE